MKPLDFSYWLKGAFEFTQTAIFTQNQVQQLSDNLLKVKFDKKDRMNVFCIWLKDYMAQHPEFRELQTISIKQKFYDEMCKINEVGQPVKYDFSVYPPELLDRC